MWVEQYDDNRDGHIQRGEAAAWLGRNAGRAASAFAVRSSRSYVSAPSAASRVWRLLDRDQDGLLSVGEIDSAAATFWTLDANDDRVISSSELATLREQLEATGMPTAVRDEVARYAAIHIEPDVDADRLEYLLSDLYSPRQTLGPSSFLHLAELYTKLDANERRLAGTARADGHGDDGRPFGAFCHVWGNRCDSGPDADARSAQPRAGSYCPGHAIGKPDCHFGGQCPIDLVCPRPYSSRWRQPGC